MPDFHYAEKTRQLKEYSIGPSKGWTANFAQLNEVQRLPGRASCLAAGLLLLDRDRKYHQITGRFRPCIRGVHPFRKRTISNIFDIANQHY
jgi:hypothetical protein